MILILVCDETVCLEPLEEATQELNAEQRVSYSKVISFASMLYCSSLGSM